MCAKLITKSNHTIFSNIAAIAIIAVMVGATRTMMDYEKTASLRARLAQTSKTITTQKLPKTSQTSQNSTTTITPTAAHESSPAAPTPSAPTHITTTAPKTLPTPTPTPTPTPPPVTYTYHNGTYSATGSFPVIGSIQKIGIGITIYQDIITATTATPMATGNTSIYYEADFISNYKPFVVGKSVASLSLSKISSASLTPNGFNNALDQIRTQAK